MSFLLLFIYLFKQYGTNDKMKLDNTIDFLTKRLHEVLLEEKNNNSNKIKRNN